MGRRWTIWLAVVAVAAACVGCGSAATRASAPCGRVGRGVPQPLTTDAPPGPATTVVPPVPSTTPAPATTPPTTPATGPATVPSALALEVAPVSVTLDGSAPQPLVVTVANTGTGRIENLSVTLSPPPGVEWRPDSPVDRLTLGPQDRLVVRGTLVGRRTVGAATSVAAQGRAVDGGRTVAEVATVDHPAAPPLGTLTVTGGGDLSNGRNLDLLAVVTNTSDGPINAAIAATSTNRGKIEVSVACPADIGPGDSAVFAVTVDGGDLRAGSETATVTANLSRDTLTDQLVATHPFTTSPFGDTTLVGPLGLSSLLLLPGIAAVLAWSVLRVYPRRRRGVVTSALPDVRSLGTAISVVLAAAGAVEAYRLLGGESLYDGYSTWTLALVTLLAGSVALGAGLARWRYIELRYPVLDADSDARAALAALRSWSLPAGTVEEVPGRVVWVHDGAACTVTGLEVRGTIGGSTLDDALAQKNLRQLQRIVRDNPSLQVAYVALAPDGPVAGARTGAVKDDFRPQGRAAVITYSVTV